MQVRRNGPSGGAVQSRHSDGVGVRGDRDEEMAMSRKLLLLLLLLIVLLAMALVASLLYFGATVAENRVAAQGVLDRLAAADPPEASELMNELVDLGAPGMRCLLGLREHEAWYIRAEAARALGETGDQDAVPALFAALKDDSWMVRAAAVEATYSLVCGSACDRDAIDATQLVAALRDKSVEVRARVANLLRKFPSPQVVQALIICMKGDSSPIVRATAANALGGLADRTATPALCEALRDSAEEVQEQALMALNTIRDPRSSRALAAMLADESSPTQALAASALTRCAAEKAVPALAEAIADDSEEIRTQAVRALASVQSPRAANAMLGAISDTSPALRALAIKHIRKHGSADTVLRLIPCLRDESEYVREEACYAIWKTTGGGFDGIEKGPEKMLEWWEKEGKYEHGKQSDR